MTKLPAVPAEWAKTHKTHPAVAMAIHDLSNPQETPEEIWRDTSETNTVLVGAIVKSYMRNGLIQGVVDGVYAWGGHEIFVPFIAQDTVTEGVFSGLVSSVANGLVEQKINRNGDTVVHDAARLTETLSAGAVVDITYKDGIGIVFMGGNEAK